MRRAIAFVTAVDLTFEKDNVDPPLDEPNTYIWPLGHQLVAHKSFAVHLRCRISSGVNIDPC
jgi:hypothetical protein